MHINIVLQTMYCANPGGCCERWRGSVNLGVTVVYIAQKLPFNKVSKVSQFQEVACKEKHLQE